MPRQPNTDPPVRKTISLPKSLVERIEIITRDPIYDRPGYGRLSGLVAKLLFEHLDKIERKSAEELDELDNLLGDLNT